MIFVKPVSMEDRKKVDIIHALFFTMVSICCTYSICLRRRAAHNVLAQALNASLAENTETGYSIGKTLLYGRAAYCAQRLSSLASPAICRYSIRKAPPAQRRHGASFPRGS